MFKWFAYIVVGLILMPFLLAARPHRGSAFPPHHSTIFYPDSSFTAVADTTTKKQQSDDKKKVKEVTRAKPVPKPEKIDNSDEKAKKRHHRPPGMERPPEIPRHNGN
jgi:hypothetical protein